MFQYFQPLIHNTQRTPKHAYLIWLHQSSHVHFYYCCAVTLIPDTNLASVILLSVSPIMLSDGSCQHAIIIRFYLHIAVIDWMNLQITTIRTCWKIGLLFFVRLVTLVNIASQQTIFVRCTITIEQSIGGSSGRGHSGLTPMSHKTCRIVLY